MAKKDTLKKLHRFLEGVVKEQKEARRQAQEEKEAGHLALMLSGFGDVTEAVQEQNKVLKDTLQEIKSNQKEYLAIQKASQGRREDKT